MKPLILVLAAVSMTPFFGRPEIAGTWVGSGTLANDWTDASNPQIRLRCVYVGKARPPAITLRVPAGGGVGQLVLDIPSSEPACPHLRKTYQIDAAIGGQRMTFTDPAGNDWSLTLTEDLLLGDVKWRAESKKPDEALAVGFIYRPPLRPGDVPLTRLSGKVTLSRRR